MIKLYINIFEKTEEKFSLNGYNKGVYFITATSKKGIKTSKLIVE